MTSEFGKAPSSYTELSRLRTPGAYRARTVAAFILAVFCRSSAPGLPQVPTVGTSLKGLVPYRALSVFFWRQGDISDTGSWNWRFCV